MLAKRLTRRGVALSGGALAAVLTRQAAAGVPNSVVVSTIKSATLVAAGKAAGTGAPSVQVAVLTEGVMKAMLFNKLKAALAVVLMLGFGATGATLLTYRKAAGQDDKKHVPEKPVKPAVKEKVEEAFTAWGKEIHGLQAGLGFRLGQRRTYIPGETFTLVVRVRNVGKEEVKLSYLQPFIEHSPTVTDIDGKPVPQPMVIPDIGEHLPGEVELPPGKEIELHELKRQLRPASESSSKKVMQPYPLYGTGKVSVQYEQVLGTPSMGLPGWKIDPTMSKLATGKLELEVRPDPPPATPKKGASGPSDQKANENLTPRKEVDPKAVEIIERAIKSHGGADALKKYTGGWSQATSKATAADSDILITSETTFQYPDKYRTAIRIDIKPPANGIEVNGGPVRVQSSEIVQVFDGRKAKKTLNGTACELDEQEKAQHQAGFVLLNVRRLTPLLDDSRYTLNAEQDVGGEHVVEVTANPLQSGRMPFSFFLGVTTGVDVKAFDFPAKGVQGVRLYLDKKTGLLVKTSHRAIDPGTGDRKEVTIDTLFTEHKDVQGVKVPMKQVTRVNGKELATMTVTEARMLEVVDPKTFNVE
jgi:hypothetical protein